MENTHSEIIKFSDGSTAILYGVPDECKHEWNGSSYFVSASGKFITWKTYRQFAGFTDQYRSLKIHELHNEIEDPIVECGGTCSKCGKAFRPNLF